MPSKIFLIPTVALAALMPCCYMSTGTFFSDDVSTDSSHDPAAEDWDLEENLPFDAPDSIEDPAEPETFDDDPTVGEDAVEVPGDPDVLDPDLPPDDSMEDPLDVAELPPGLVWVSIPAGSFEMGCLPGDADCDFDESPRHTVNISTFRMTEAEVTQAQYEAVTGETPSRFSGCPDCPVERVTWHEAKAFCEAIGGRLPSEAEWEFAARAGTTTRYYCGDDSACLDDIAWYGANSRYVTHPVAEKMANAFGLYDMLGNVWEWIEDCWHDDYNGAPSTGRVWTEGANCFYRVQRGGSWTSLDEYLRVSERNGYNPDSRNSWFGLRCAQ